MMSKRKATIQDLQKLCGFLNFLTKAIHPGRVFTRRMYAKYTHIIDLKMVGESHMTPKFQYKLKKHHHVQLDNEFKFDCAIWLEFLQSE